MYYLKKVMFELYVNKLKHHLFISNIIVNIMQSIFMFITSQNFHKSIFKLYNFQFFHNYHIPFQAIILFALFQNY